MILAVISILLFIAYGVLIIYFYVSWKSIPLSVARETEHKINFSIIIPARNEEKNIGRLLDAITAQDYPAQRFEVIVVDDESEDATAAVVSAYANARLIRLPATKINSRKKRALTTGIASAIHEYIITTDADCEPPSGWLAAIASIITRENPVLVAAPVVIECNSSLVQVFQCMDFMVLQGITGAAVHKRFLSMCNGANLIYRKDAFHEVNGFEGIDNIASGDDMLLMHKIRNRYPQRLSYLKSHDAIVKTAAVATWKEFFRQRIRWASKATVYEDKRIIFILALVYLFNLSFVTLFIAGWWYWHLWLVMLGLAFFKTIIELPFFHNLAIFFNKKWTIKYFILLQPLHIAYTLVAGWLGQIGKYEWKGRNVS